MIRSIKSEGNTIYVLHSLIKKIKVPVSTFTIKKDLLDHPNYPSMLALRDCLSSWKVPNETFSIRKETFDLSKLPLPFIAHLNRNEGEFILVNGISEDSINFSNEKEPKGVLKKSEFLKFWDGVFLIAEKDEESGEKDFTQSLIKHWINEARIPFLLIILLGCIFYSINFSGSNLAFLTLVMIKILGVGVSSLLLIHSINVNNPFIQNICSLGKKNDCNAILKSNAAKVTSWLNWSEVGMFYFTGSLICLLLNSSNIVLLSWLNLLCLPYTIFSIGYQVKTKNWCVLCCTVQVLLWMELAAFYSTGVSFQSVDFGSNIIIVLICFLSPIAIWAYIKPYLLKSEQTDLLKLQLKKFKYNDMVFNKLMGLQPQHLVTDDLMPIILGNPKSETIITMVSNPYCGPCGMTHNILDEWLDQRDDIQVRILFTFAEYEHGLIPNTIKHLMSLGVYADKTLLKQALSDWYNQSSKNYYEWAEKYPSNISPDIDTAFQKQKKWCEMADVSFTPTIFINGYKLINLYKLEDIKYLLE